MYIDLDNLKNFNPNTRRIILVFIDILTLIFLIWLTFWLRLGDEASNRIISCLWLFPSVIIIGISTYYFTGQYRGITRHLQSKALYQISGRNFLIILLVSLTGVMGQFNMPPRSSWILLWILMSVFIGGIRFVIRDLLIRNRKRIKSKKSKSNIVIYGAGTSGARLASSLKIEDSSNVIFFIDDSPLLIGRSLNGIPIKSPKILNEKNYQIDRILIAISSITISKRNLLINKLNKLKIPIHTIPSIEDIITKKLVINPKTNLIIEDLLGRSKVLPDPSLLSEGISEKSVLITGAGGSIGSELCRQLIKLNPSKIVLLELSEIALYQIEKELKASNLDGIILKGYLGSASDENLLRNIFEINSIEIVFHCAAYKHVPIVEMNPLIGISNNVFSTKVICKVSKDLNISKFILISTDKAVRPTNFMGASKRLAELVVQGYAKEVKNGSSNKLCRTKFSMVRFGNVLNSSGSVVPIFKEQISKGGPLTITHKNIIRYFMTIEEASQLVIQASKLASGGDLFVLDMGNPVKITELAEQMINLSGLKLKNKSNPDGDIEIVFTGLRPGEKLYEELLIDAECLSTSHPLIFRALEKSEDPEKLWDKLKLLEIELKKYNLDTTIEILSDLVPEWVIKKHI